MLLLLRRFPTIVTKNHPEMNNPAGQVILQEMDMPAERLGYFEKDPVSCQNFLASLQSKRQLQQHHHSCSCQLSCTSSTPFSSRAA